MYYLFQFFLQSYYLLLLCVEEAREAHKLEIYPKSQLVSKRPGIKPWRTWGQSASVWRIQQRSWKMCILEKIVLNLKRFAQE